MNYADNFKLFLYTQQHIIYYTTLFLKFQEVKQQKNAQSKSYAIVIHYAPN